MSEIKESRLNRRKFMASMGLLGAVAGLRPLDVFSDTPAFAAAPASVMKCKPYLQAPLPDSMTVRWITRVPCHSWVEYGESPDKLNLKARQIEDGMVQVDNTIHAITLSNLQPGKTYYYRVASQPVVSLERKSISFGKTSASEISAFTAPAEHADEVNFLVFNDIHDRPESFAHLMKFQGEGKKDFVLLNGDMFNKQEDEDQIIEHLLNPLSDLFATSTPFIFARGNHETWGGYSRNLGDYFDGREHKFYHSFQYGPVYGVVLDSGETKPDEDPVNGGIIDFDAYREIQAAWLEKEVQKKAFKKAKYRIVFIHIPAFYLGSEAHAAMQYNKIWGPILNRSKIDLMLCGHTHRYGVHPPVPGQHNYPIVIGGGPKDGKRTIINIKANQKALNLTMTDDSGKVVGMLNL